MLVPYHIWENQLYFLCMRPSNSKYGGSSYQFCKGRIEDGETSEIAALREASEELGLCPENVNSIYYVSRVMNGTCDLYVCEYKTHPTLIINDETVHTAFLSDYEFMVIGRDWQKPICKTVTEFINGLVKV